MHSFGVIYMFNLIATLALMLIGAIFTMDRLTVLQRHFLAAQDTSCCGLLATAQADARCLPGAGPAIDCMLRSNTRASVGRLDEFPQATSMSVFPPAAHDMLDLDALLSTEERRVRQAVRRFAVRAAELKA